MIGASAGGFDVLRKLVAGLPADLDASVFIVWHMAPDVKGVLPQVLSQLGTLPASHATDGEAIRTGQIYIAPPDHHLTLEREKIRVTKGPKVNRFRPAVDPLFRSAAFAYGARVIGVILSGALDDGAAGLWAIKQCGGLAVAQDPADAEVPSMPENAIHSSQPDHIVPASELAELLAKLAGEEIEDRKETIMKENGHPGRKAQVQEENPVGNGDFFNLHALTPYTCPECHGVLSAIKENDRIRFRCHTGHAFSFDSLLSALTESVEESLWTAIRGIQESKFLLNHMGDHLAEVNEPKLAAAYFKKAREAESRLQMVRQAAEQHEYLTAQRIREQAESNGFGEESGSAA